MDDSRRKIPEPPAPGPKPPIPKPPVTGLSMEEQQMLNVVNKARQDAELSPLAVHPRRYRDRQWRRLREKVHSTIYRKIKTSPFHDWGGLVYM